LDGLKDDGKKATFFVDEKRKDELKALADDLAIVCPLVDGRMKDLGDDQQWCQAPMMREPLVQPGWVSIDMHNIT
jgi:hypothetical protein